MIIQSIKLFYYLEELKSIKAMMFFLILLNSLKMNLKNTV
jgi:hypothetical protein